MPSHALKIFSNRSVFTIVKQHVQEGPIREADPQGRGYLILRRKPLKPLFSLPFIGTTSLQRDRRKGEKTRAVRVVEVRRRREVSPVPHSAAVRSGTS